MNYFEKILSIDFGSHGFSSIDQLVFIKISYCVVYELGLSTNELCLSCSCSKPTLLASISKLETLGFICVVRLPGVVSSYSLNYGFIDTLLSKLALAKINLDSLVGELNSIDSAKIKPLKVTKNQRKRMRKKGSTRW